MAFVNPNKPCGLAPVASLVNGSYFGKGRVYAIPVADATYNYFIGDLVSLSGTNSVGAVGGDVNGIPLITMCTAGQTAVGVIMAIGTNLSGPWLNPNNLNQNYVPITKTQVYYALVNDDPFAIYEIQESGASTNLTTSVIGLNANIVLGAAATAATPGVYISQTTLNNATAPATTATYNLKILGLKQAPDNHFVTSPTTGGGAQKWWVMINNHQYRGGVAGN